jgi:glycosyltransferase involved in cell wall biosynthesis
MVTPSYPPWVGGVERHVSEVHSALRRLGLNGHIVVFRRRPDSGAASEDETWINSDRLWGWVPKSSRLKVALRLARILLDHPGAVLHFHDYHTIHPMLPLLRLLGRLPRSYVTFHGWEGNYPPDPKVVKARQQCARLCRANMAIGDFIPKWYHTRADVISYGGVDVGLYGGITERCDQLPLRVAYVGRLERDNGVMELVEAVRLHCKSSGRALELRLFGRGSLESELARLAPTDSFLPTVSPPVADLRDVLRAFPIIFASGYLTMIEALCARRIVFAYYDNPLREDYLRLHPAAGSIFICGSAHEVTNALAKCEQSVRWACEFSEPGWRWARKQSWDKLALQYTALWGL